MTYFHGSPRLLHTSVSPGKTTVTVGCRQHCCPAPSVSQKGKQDWSVGLGKTLSANVLQELKRTAHLPVIDASSPMAHQEWSLSLLPPADSEMWLCSTIFPFKFVRPHFKIIFTWSLSYFLLRYSGAIVGPADPFSLWCHPAEHPWVSEPHGVRQHVLAVPAIFGQWNLDINI